jgi:hypothetical protein
LPLKPEFVPLLLRMVNHAERRAEFEAPSVVSADGAAEIAVDAKWSPAVATITDVEGHTADVKFERAGSRLVGGFERTSLKGYYTIEVRGGRAEQPKSAATAFAVNLSPEESQFIAADENQLRGWLPGADVKVIDASAEAQQQLGAIGDEREVWRYLLLAMFAVIGIEFMLATLGGRKVETDDDATMGERLRRYTPGSWVGRMTGANEPVESN